MSDVETDIGPFAIVPEWLLFDPAVSAMAVRVFGMLARHEGPGGAYPSAARLGGLAGVSDDTIRRAIRELVDVEAVEIIPRFREDGGQTSNFYRLHMLPRSRNDADGVVRGDADGVLRMVAERTKALKNESPTNETDPTDRPTPAPTRRVLTEAAALSFAEEFPQFDLVEARLDFLNYGPNRRQVDQLRGFRNMLKDPKRNHRFLKEGYRGAEAIRQTNQTRGSGRGPTVPHLDGADYLDDARRLGLDFVS